MALPCYQVKEKNQMTDDLKGQKLRPVVTGESGQLFQPKLLPRLRETLRLCRYSLKMEKDYLWAWQFVFSSPTPDDVRERPLWRTEANGRNVVEADAAWRSIFGSRMASPGR